MTQEGPGVMTVSRIQQAASSYADKLLSSSGKITKHLNYQIRLLEVFNHEVKRLEKAGHCDYELAVFCYQTAQTLCRECQRHAGADVKDFVETIASTLSRKQANYGVIKTYMDTHGTENAPSAKEAKDESLDPLITRLNRLKAAEAKAKAKALEASAASSVGNLEQYKLSEVISCTQLHELLNNYSDKYSVLLVDFRTRKEHEYNHINYRELVNIEPSIVSSLLGPENKNNADSITDQDLEERLRLLLPDDQYTRFANRHKYDLIVIYNLRYGTATKVLDRFDALIAALLNDTNDFFPPASPFNQLIELLAYRNKYISSRLKRTPCYLSGGVSYWFECFGGSSIAKATNPQILLRPQPSMSRANSSSASLPQANSSISDRSTDSLKLVTNGSPYLKNFADYLGTAKTTTSTPVSSLNGSPHQPDNLYNVSRANDSIGLKPYYPSSSTFSTKPAPSLEAKPAQVVSQQPQKPERSSSFSLAKQAKPAKSSSTSSSSTSSKSNPVAFLKQYTTGLTNLGNSCYMNCVLQCLGATPQLTKFFFPTLPTDSSAALQSYKQHININNKLGTKGIITTSFVTLLMNMFGNSGGSFSPANFKKVVGSLSPGKQFQTFDQQDCIEFLNFLLDSLHEDLNQMIVLDPEEKKRINELTPEQEKTREYLPVRLASTIEWERYLKLNFSIVVDYFQGQYLSQLRCLECGNTSTTYNAFAILSLPIPERLVASKTITLDDCLKEFVQTELLDDDNKWHCPRCKRFTRATKRIMITRLPQVLIIHFKRFKITSSGYFNKMDDMIRYPVNDVLDLTPYWPHVGTSLNDDREGIMNKEKEAQVLATLPTRNQEPPFRYKLYGVANHYGNLTTGHYTSYVYKDSDSKKIRGWCYFDDSKVTYNQKESQVLNKNAYCLFYQRI